MPANVQSLEAILAVRAALASFRNDVDQALTSIDLEMRKVLDWLEHDRPRFWRTQVREAADAVTQARAALHRCLMYPINDERPSCYEERAELKKAQAHFAYCEEKSERLRHWIRDVRHEMFDYEGRVSQLKDLVEIDTPRAMAILDRLVERLHEYQSIRVRSGSQNFAAPAAEGLAASAVSDSFARELMPDPPPKPATVLEPSPVQTATPAEELP
jgi:hypothetical protein